MLIIDTKAVFKDPKQMSARGAGVLGLMRYGTDHHFVLDNDLEFMQEEMERFLEKNMMVNLSLFLASHI